MVDLNIQLTMWQSSLSINTVWKSSFRSCRSMRTSSMGSLCLNQWFIQPPFSLQLQTPCLQSTSYYSIDSQPSLVLKCHGLLPYRMQKCLVRNRANQIFPFLLDLLEELGSIYWRARHIANYSLEDAQSWFVRFSLLETKKFLPMKPTPRRRHYAVVLPEK